MKSMSLGVVGFLLSRMHSCRSLENLYHLIRDWRLTICTGSLGHAAMLSHVGLLTDKEFSEIKTGIEELQEEILRDDFPWKLELEDVHMNLEQALRRKNRSS